MLGARYIVVGRSRDCDLVLEDKSVSGRHARLSWRKGRVLVEDLGSANGTFVGDKRVLRADVRPGDEVRFGTESLAWSSPSLQAFLRGGARGDTEVRPRVPPKRRAPSLRVLGAAALLILSLGLGWWVVARPNFRTALDRVATGMGLKQPASIKIASRQEQSVRMHTVPRVITALDAQHPTTRNAAVRIAATAEGTFRVEQVAQLWSFVREKWSYVNDPHGDEYFARASETITNGYAGDCDDFSIVLASMIAAIGGQARVVLMDGPDGGHAYTEVCLNENPEEAAQRLSRHYGSKQGGARKRAPRVDEIHFRTSPSCAIWLNLDWNAGVPGGAYGSEAWAVAIHPDGRTETLAAAPGNPRAEEASGRSSAGPPPPL